MELMDKSCNWKLLGLVFAGLFFGCEDQPVSPPEKITIEYTIKDASGFNENDGAIDVTLTDVQPPVSFFWSNGETTEDISNLYAGDYVLKVTYEMSGVSEATITVGQPEPDELQLEYQVTDASRYAKMDGSVALTVSGGTPPYQAIWNGTDTTLLLEGIGAGTYEVEVTDASQPFRVVTSGLVSVSEPEFICGVDSIPDLEGNLYPTVVIGNQCWLAQNLRTSQVMVDSTLMEIDGLYCAGTSCYDARGAHYTWESAMNGGEAASEPYAMVQGICPEGFYLPTRRVFQELDSILSIPDNYGPGNFSGAKMKGAESTSGFDALNNGNWGYGIYNNTRIAAWWTSTGFAADPGDSYYFMVTEDTPFLSSGHKPLDFGMSVRCMHLIE
jgi:uncharacterized protein (TIGR02145 family)